MESGTSAALSRRTFTGTAALADFWKLLAPRERSARRAACILQFALIIFHWLPRLAENAKCKMKNEKCPEAFVPLCLCVSLFHGGACLHARLHHERPGLVACFHSGLTQSHKGTKKETRGRLFDFDPPTPNGWPNPQRRSSLPRCLNLPWRVGSIRGCLPLRRSSRRK